MPVPSALVFHFTNLYPVLVYPFVVNDFAVSYVWLLFAVLPPVFPFPLYDIVYVFAVQLATTVLFPVVLEESFVLKSLALEKVAFAPGFIPVTAVPSYCSIFKCIPSTSRIWKSDTI